MSRKLSLVVEVELTPSRFAELGRPAGAYRNEAGSLVALASDFPLLYWPARATYDGHRLRHRLSLYSADLGRRIAVFDGARYPINDVAFHPSRPMVAIATGSYDGGWAFDGELILWSWEAGETVRVLSESREVSRVRFVDGEALALLLRPRFEEEYEADDAFEIFVGGTLRDLRGFAALGLGAGDPDPRVARFSLVEPSALELEPGSSSREEQARSWRKHAGAAAPEPRGRVWDVAWRSADQLLAVHDGCHLEAWTLDGRRALHLQGEGHGVQLLHHAGHTFVNVIERVLSAEETKEQCALVRLEGDALAPVARFPHIMLFSVDRGGRILCRDTGDLSRKRVRQDQVLDAAGRVALRLDLGHYDCFNHHLRIDGSDELYFLRGNPTSSHEHKALCGIDAAGEVHERFPWDTAERHLMGSTACLVSPSALVRAYRVYDPSPARHACYLEALELATGRRRWHHPITALATSLLPIEGKPWLVYALTDGRIGVMHADTGQQLGETTLSLDGVSTVVLSMSALGERIACGTIDGRLLLLRAEAV